MANQVENTPSECGGGCLHTSDKQMHTRLQQLNIWKKQITVIHTLFVCLIGLYIAFNSCGNMVPLVAKVPMFTCMKWAYTAMQRGGHETWNQIPSHYALRAPAKAKKMDGFC